MQSNHYEEYLTTIANTRLLFNSIQELEDYFGNHSIHSNGIKRSFGSPQRMRAAFRDLVLEVSEWTNDTINLECLLVHYKRAWTFYRDNLSRRSNPEKLALELLNFCYVPQKNKGKTKIFDLFQTVIDQQINVPILLLLILKVLPGYDSKGGDAVDMGEAFERTTRLLDTFTSNGTPFEVLPAMTHLRDEEEQTRLSLILHVTEVLDTFEKFASNTNIYNTSEEVKATLVNPDIVGFWDEQDGTLRNTDFWQVEDAWFYGSYFITHWHKDADNRLTGIRYTLFTSDYGDGKTTFYLLHPAAIKHRMQGLTYGDADHTWYQTELESDAPLSIDLFRCLPSASWYSSLHLARCTDAKVVQQCDQWLEKCTIVKPFGNCEYEFYASLFAITQDHIYIKGEREGEYYKVPRDAQEGFRSITLNDGVGLMTMVGKHYLVFDELMLYIPITAKYLEKYGITRVKQID